MTVQHHVFDALGAELENQGFRIIQSDFQRPWGGFFVIDEEQIKQFAELYFPQLADSLPQGQKLSPKILVVGPGKRLSWQYHFRRAEVWTVVQGPIAVAQSDTDAETEPKLFNAGDVIHLRQGERHRLVGLETWGVVAEIWQHTDPDQPSDESDIVRVQDDFNR